MKILVINCGSSSLKYSLIDMENEKVLAKGNFERIGQYNSVITHKINGEKYKKEIYVYSHEEALKVVMNELINKDYPVIKSFDEIGAVGHRVVHGGERFKESTIIDEDVIKGIEDAVKFAPLHNPAHLQGIRAIQNILPGVPNVAVFDTAFHQTIPKEHYIYPIPYEYYEKYGVRKYGAHGTSHKYVSHRIAEILNKDIKDLKIISCHLGQGASICAIQSGVSVDTSMGLTPLGGISMGSRSGDLDPSVVTYIMEKENLTPREMDKILNKKSGLLGISGISNDNRDILRVIPKGNERADLAIKTYCYIIAQYIGKYAVTMNGVDVITFTGGVGEKGPDERKLICSYLNFMGVELDEEKNKVTNMEYELSKDDSRVKLWIVPTEEEYIVAKETNEIIDK